MKKTLLFVVVALLSVAPLSAQSNAQPGNQKWSLGLGLLGDRTLNSNSDYPEINQGSNALGSFFMVESAFDTVWGIRAQADLFGITQDNGYDRKGGASLAVKMNISNALSHSLCRGNFYALLGAGLTQKVVGNEDHDGYGFTLHCNIGYSYWISREIGLFSELGVNMWDAAKYLSGNFSLGLLIRLY